MKIRKIIAILLSSGLIIAMCAPIAFGYSETVNSQVNSIIKKGSIVYCSDYGYLPGIYKVNLKTKKSTRLVKAGITAIESFMLQDDYIYYAKNSGSSAIYRVKVTGGQPEKLCVINREYVDWFEYAVTETKLYVNVYDYDDNPPECYEMDLDGSNLQKSEVLVNLKYKRSNVKGYKITAKKIKKGKYRVYLKTPKKKVVIIKSTKVVLG